MRCNKNISDIRAIGFKEAFFKIYIINFFFHFIKKNKISLFIIIYALILLGFYVNKASLKHPDFVVFYQFLLLKL